MGTRSNGVLRIAGSRQHLDLTYADDAMLEFPLTKKSKASLPRCARPHNATWGRAPCLLAGDAAAGYGQCRLEEVAQRAAVGVGRKIGAVKHNVQVGQVLRDVLR